MVNEKQKLKKYFKEQALPEFKIQQSRYITINGQSYAVVGQKTLKASFFSHYDVLDSNGNRAGEASTAIYKYIFMFEVTEILEQLDGLLESADDDLMFESTYIKRRYGEGINAVLRENDDIRSLLGPLINEKEKLSRLNTWEAGDFKSLELAWDAFWDVYEARMEILFKFRAFVWAHNENGGIKQTNLKNVYEEAELMYRLISESLSTDHVVMTRIDDVLQIAAELGRVPSDLDPMRFLATFERFSMHVFKNIYRLVLWGILPVSLICLMFDMYDFETISNVLFISGVFLVAYVIFRHFRKVKLTRRFKQTRKEHLASDPLIKTQYAKAYETLKLREQEADKSIYEFVATPTLLWRGMLFAGITIGILGMGVDDYGWIVTAGIILLLRFLLPLTGFANIRFQLTPEGLRFGKKAQFTMQNIIEVGVNKRGSIFIINIGLRHRQKFKIRKAYRKDSKEQIELWCDTYGLHFTEGFYL